MQRLFSSVRVRFFCLGVIATFGYLFLTGATDTNPSLQYGRYQISAWASNFGTEGGGVGAFVIDTVSGETKAVYTRAYGKIPQGTTIKNDLRKPFAAIK